MKKKVDVQEKPVIKRWSYSSWSTYDQCGRRFSYRYLEKIPEAPSAAMARGTDIHTKAEYWLKGQITGPVPKPLEKFKAQLAGLRKLKPMVEQWWNVTRDWTQAAPYQGWVLAKADAAVVVGDELVVIDHKTGKVYADKHEQQASLYATIGAALHPKVKKVTAEFWYLDQGETLSWTWTPDDIAGYQQIWGRRGDNVMEHTDLRARAGWYCKFCPYSKEHAKGPCEMG